MSHEERRRLIEAPMSVFTRHTAASWGGAVTSDIRPAAWRQPCPQDQEPCVEDDDGEEI